MPENALSLLSCSIAMGDIHLCQVSCSHYQGHSVFQYNPDERECPGWLSRQLAACRGQVRMAGASQHANGRITQGRHDMRDITTAHLGAVFIECHITYPMRLVFNVPMPAHK